MGILDTDESANFESDAAKHSRWRLRILSAMTFLVPLVLLGGAFVCPGCIEILAVLGFGPLMTTLDLAQLSIPLLLLLALAAAFHARGRFQLSLQSSYFYPSRF